jgi:hypothetical protein
MRKVYFMILAGIISSLPVFSQAYEGTIEYDKKKQQAFVIDYPYSPEAVENALVQKMDDLGYKGKEEKGIFNKDKGFIVHKGIYITEIYPSSMDYIFKVEPRNKKDKSASLIYLVILKDGQNVRPNLEAADVTKVKSFLSDLLPHVESADLEIKIRTQEDAVSKAEKKLRDLEEDQKTMERKIKDLQSDPETNAKNQENQKKLIENQKAELEGMKGKRKK